MSTTPSPNTSKEHRTPSLSKEYGKTTWGRNADGSLLVNNLWLFGVLLLSPLLPYLFYLSCAEFQCEVSAPFIQIVTGKLSLIGLVKMVPLPNYTALTIFIVWYFLHTLLYVFLPGKAYGQNTPAGNRLEYNVNGLKAWVITHIFFGLCVVAGVISPTIVYDNWGPLLFIANVWGFVLSTFCYLKAKWFPTYPEDSKFTGNIIYDYVMGVELNPRIGVLDFKLFFNGRPGIGGWNIINLSFMAAQYKMYGEITNSMYLVTFLHVLYILDFFWNEVWYLSTIDIHHDHFGWYLGWGDSVWLPFTYTLQGFYLTVHPYKMSTPEFLFVLLLGLSGYVIFRLANEQKTYFRTTPLEKCKIWGKQPTFIEASYTTADGQEHQSNLLTSGFWGLSRHFNYFGDLLISFAYCACCGYHHLLPYWYIIFMTGLLIGRVGRDNTRLKEKYGKKWDEYCKIVRWKILPYVY
eukprot:TRINITY_DN885_c1_g1_i1.p1 TRINITY_DN885_c1_g1~~TRINITY_DN885_c1_g1_i1.p1  ORF type:complete len:462 (+),score=43.77 TRINITY_DN885_c1_g1_i1:57-1442(+)